MNEPGTIGDRELALLRWVEDHGGASVGEAAEGFGAEAGLARSTILTMMERLRAKRHLRRRAVGGVFRYEPVVATTRVERGAVAAFVERTLGGSISPFVSYLAETDRVDEAELAELERLVERLRERSGGKP